MDLITRDRPEHGGAGVLCAGQGETLRERWRGAIVYDLGGRQRRMGATIGPCHHDLTGPWTADAPHTGAGLDLWEPIDLRPGLSAQGGVVRRVHRAGITSDFFGTGAIRCERGGAKTTLRPVALAWVNDAGDRQVIGTPTIGRIASDEDGLWAPDAFGPGLDWGMRLWPDCARPVVRIARPGALPHPTIGPRGLRLAKILSVGHDGGRVVGLQDIKAKRAVRPDLLSGRADEVRRPTAPMPLRASEGDALWFAGARAWDDEQTWEVRSEWQRYGADVQVVCSLPIEAVLAARGALLLDTTMAEQQVGASADDSSELGTGSTFPVLATLEFRSNTLTTSSSYRCCGARWTPPVPQGATITSASVGWYLLYDSPNGNMYFEDVADSANYTTTTAVISRTRTTAYTSWISIGTATNDWYAIDAAAPLGEVVSRGDWVSGNGMSALLIANNDANYTGSIRSFDGNASLAAKLNATYTEGAGATGSPWYYYAQQGA